MTAEPGSIASVSDLTVSYGSRKALAAVSIDFGRGDVTGVRGSNGSGKSTLLLVLAGLLRPSMGACSVSGPLGFVLQQTAVDDLLTVQENLRFFTRIAGGTHKQIPHLLEGSGLADRADDRVGTLSGGLRRRVDLLRALCGSPELLLLDEPTAGLDRDARQGFAETLLSLRDSMNLSVIWVSHDAAESVFFDREIELHDGRLVHDSTAVHA